MTKENKRTAIIFPGQGSQEKGMGRDVAETFSDIMDLWKRAEKICKSELREIYWEGDEEEMKRTRYLQPAMVVVGLGLWYALEKKGIEINGLAGHSLGEYTALGVARVLEIDQLLQLVSLRGKLMDEANSDGAMAAVLKLSEDKVKEVVDEIKNKYPDKVICIANYNSPSQFVVSGHKDCINELSVKVKALKGRAISLAVSGAFHSDLMKEACTELSKFMEKLDWKNAIYPIYLNVTAKPETRAESIKEIMKKQMISSVLWTQLVLNQYNDGFRKWIELGPKGVLSRLVKQILKAKEDVEAICVDTLEKIEKLLLI